MKVSCVNKLYFWFIKTNNKNTIASYFVFSTIKIIYAPFFQFLFDNHSYEICFIICQLSIYWKTLPFFAFIKQFIYNYVYAYNNLVILVLKIKKDIDWRQHIVSIQTRVSNYFI